MESKKTVRIEKRATHAASFSRERPYGGRYSPVRRLGEGSMGVVYEAVDRETGARVALKTLSGAAPGAIYHLKNEFRALTDLVHPNLVTLHELVVDEASWFFTMELVEGVPFDDYVRDDPSAEPAPVLRGEPTELLHAVGAGESREHATQHNSAPFVLGAQPLDEARLVRALVQLAAGIHALHEAGRLHRDLKPSNVLVTAAGQVKILDFGLVSDDSADPIGQTVVGRLAGTPAYMAPEQASGERPSPASDWYAFGVMLYEALTGRVPFDGPIYELLIAKHHEKPIPPSELAQVPSELEALCLSLLAVRPEARPSGAEVIAQLHALAPLYAAATQPSASTKTDEPAGASLVPPPSAAGRSSGPRPAMSFVGREAELRVLHETLRATGGAPRVLHLIGASGIGKSALAGHFAERLATGEGTVVLRGRCFERESVPYKGIDGIIDALSRHLRRLLPRDVRRVLPRNVHALCRLFPVLARVDAVVNAPRRGGDLPLDPSELRRLAWGALRDLLGRVADETPLLLCIDDFQWADRDSAQLLSALLAPPDPPALMLLLTYRSEERRSGSGIGLLLEELEKHAIPQRTLELDGLGLEHVTELIAAYLPDGQGLDPYSCYRESEGNPFLVHELLRQAQANALAGRGTTARLDLDGAIRARVEGLPEELQRMLFAAALAARPTHFEVIAQAAAASGDVRAAVRKLQAGSFLRTSTHDPNLVETYHDRLRSGVVHMLGAGEQRALHERLAAVLLEHGAEPETLTEHFLAAGDSERAFVHALHAAPRAERALSFERAARFYRLAIELAEKIRPAEAPLLYTRHAEALASAGRSLEAAAAYERAAEHAPLESRARLRVLASTHVLLSGRAEEGLARLDRALVGYGVPELGDEQAAREHITRTFAEYSALAERLDNGIVWRAENELSEEELTRLELIHSATLGLAWLDMGSRYFALALEDARGSLAAREPRRVLASASLFGSLVESIGGALPPAAASLVAQAQALTDDPRALAWADYGRGASAYFHGRFRDAVEPLARAETTFRDRCRGAARENTIVRIPLLISLRWSGQLDLVMASCERWEAAAREQGDVFTQLWMQLLDIAPLCSDRPAYARQRIEDSIARLATFVTQGASASSAAVVRLIGQVRRAEVDWYDGANASAYEHVHRFLRERSEDTSTSARSIGRDEASGLPLHTMQQVWHRARAFCGMVAVRGELDAELKTELDALIALHSGFSIPMMSTPQLLHAAVANVQGDRTLAAKLLLEEARYSERTGNPERAACYRLQAGRVLGAADGSAFCEAAEAELRALGVKNPVRWARTLAPGF